MHQGAFVRYVEINDKSFRTVVATVPLDAAVIKKSVDYTCRLFKSASMKRHQYLQDTMIRISHAEDLICMEKGAN